MVVDIDTAAVDAWEECQKDGETNWVAVKYSGKDELTLAGSGTGGLEEFREILGDEIIYAGVRVYGVNEDGNEKRSKFILIVYVPSGVSGMKKARVSVHKGPVVKNLFKVTHISIEAISAGQLTNTELEGRLNSACASHKPHHWEFGGSSGGGEGGEDVDEGEDVEEEY